MELVAEGTLKITGVTVNEDNSVLCYEGDVGKYGRVFATHVIKSRDGNRNQGNFTGHSRTILEDGNALSATLQGIWSRDGGKMKFYSLDESSHGDQNFIRGEVDLLSRDCTAKVYAL